VLVLGYLAAAVTNEGGGRRRATQAIHEGDDINNINAKVGHLFVAQLQLQMV